jgi:NADPH2:quinone reductase
MTAWRVELEGPIAEALQSTVVDRPQPGGGEVLVRVRAASLNFPDVLMIRGQYQTRPEVPFTPGVELCGDVVSEDGPLPVGTRVMGIANMPHGALGSFAVCVASKVSPAPAWLSDAEAAAFSISFHTGWLALRHRARLTAGETLVVHAAVGGVGSAAVLLGKAMGARVVAVVGSEEKARIAADLGADAIVVRTEHAEAEGLAAAIREACGPRGEADVAFDPVGGDSFRASLRAIASGGRLAVIGFASGDIPQLKLNQALLRNIDIVGVYWGGYVQTDPALLTRVADEVAAFAEKHQIRPLVSQVLDIGDAPRGLAILEQGVASGRIVLAHPQH